MNLYDAALMDAPSLTPGYCVVCGSPHPTAHHVVKRSQGGTKGPVLHLCGDGTRGCHGLAEQRRLHFRHHNHGWWYVATGVPTKYDTVLERGVWMLIGGLG